MRVELLTTVDQLERLAPEWNGLEGLPPVPVPFATSDWVICWWRHLSENRRSIRDRNFTLAVRDDQSRLLGVAPMMITERPGVGPLRMRYLQFIGADANITELRTLLALPGSEGVVYRAVADFVRESHARWDWMRWTGVHAGGEGVRVLDEEKQAWGQTVTSWVLPLPATWEEFRSGLSRNIKESLRKSVNAPRRNGLDLHLEVASRPEEMKTSVSRFFELHRQRAAVSDAVSHGDMFTTEAKRRFLSELSARMALRGVIHFFNLKLGDTTVATRIGFRLGNSMYLYFSGYDPAYGKYSVMTACLADAIRWCIGQHLQTANLSTGTDVSKTRWGPQPHLFREIHMVSPRFRGKISHAAYCWVERRIGMDRARKLFARLARRPA